MCVCVWYDVQNSGAEQSVRRGMIRISLEVRWCVYVCVWYDVQHSGAEQSVRRGMIRISLEVRWCVCVCVV